MTREEIQLLLSGIALVLTPFLSAAVVRHQLKRSHFWWTKQQQYLKEKEYEDHKYKLYEQSAKLFPSLNALLLEQQVFMFSKNECIYLLRHCNRQDIFDLEDTAKEEERYKNLVFEHNAIIREKLAELLQVTYIARGFYGEEMHNKFKELYSKMKAAKSQLIPINELITIMNSTLDSGATLDDARNERGVIFDERWSQLRIGEMIVPILDEMYSQTQKPGSGSN